jgi:hypothetical protein
MVQDPDITPLDPEFLAMKDDDLKAVLEFCLYKDYPSYTLDTIPNKAVYPLILLSKIELYQRLSTKTAPLYTVGFGDSSVKESERYEHYMRLVSEVRNEYSMHTSNNTQIEVGQIYLANKYFSQRTYNNMERPTVSLAVDNVYSDKVEISWSNASVKRFADFMLYLDTKPILDPYSEKGIRDEVTQYKQKITDIHINKYRITGLLPNTTYYVAIAVEEMNGLKGFSEMTFQTLLA